MKGLCKRCYNRRWQRQHPGINVERVRRWREANPEKRIAQSRRWSETNREKERERGRRYYEANRDKEAARQRRWNEANPNKAREQARRRRARQRRALMVPFTTEQLAARMAFWGDQCWMCAGPFEEVDHMIPLANGGPHCLSNLRPACRSCNRSKSAKDWREVAA